MLIFSVDVQQNGYEETRARQTLEAALARLRALPGVTGASMSSHRLIANSSSFLETMGIRIPRGRGFSRADVKSAPQVAVINEALARQLFGTSDVVGRQFLLGLQGKTVVQIVGVSADARYTSLRATVPPTAYLSYRQSPLGGVTFEVRTTGDAKAMAPAIREAMREVDGALPLVNLRTQDDQILESLTQKRLLAALATLLGAVTLLLSGIGVYGLRAE